MDTLLECVFIWGLLKLGPGGYKPLTPAGAPKQMSPVLATKMGSIKILNCHYILDYSSPFKEVGVPLCVPSALVHKYEIVVSTNPPATQGILNTTCKRFNCGGVHLKGRLYPSQKDITETVFQGLILAHLISDTGLGSPKTVKCFNIPSPCQMCPELGFRKHSHRSSPLSLQSLYQGLPPSQITCIISECYDLV